MRQIPWKKLIETFIIGAAGGAAFYALNFPLPWLLDHYCLLCYGRHSQNGQCIHRVL